jgi:hypothetical protein
MHTNARSGFRDFGLKTAHISLYHRFKTHTCRDKMNVLLQSVESHSPVSGVASLRNGRVENCLIEVGDDVGDFLDAY